MGCSLIGDDKTFIALGSIDRVLSFRSIVLRTFGAAVRELGGDPEALATRAGLPIAVLDQDDLPVPASALNALLELAAKTLGRPDLGLLMAEQSGPALLSRFEATLSQAPTVAKALDQATRALTFSPAGPGLSMTDDPDGARHVVVLRLPEDWYVSPVATDLALLSLHRGIRFLTGGDYGPRSVELTHEPAIDPSRYTEAFGAAAHFGRPTAMLRIPAGVLSRGVVLPASPRGTSERSATAWRVRDALSRRLGTESTGLADVAGVLAVHPRTLQRILADEGLTFGRILDCVRRERAREYLTTTDLPLTRITELLGLAEQAVLSRCARRWWGTNPVELRRADSGAGLKV